MTLIYTSDNSVSGFDATAVGSLPAGWTALTGSWSAQAQNPLPGHTKTLANTTKQDGSITLYSNGSPTAADMEITYAFKLDSTDVGVSRSGIGAIVRADNTFATGYVYLYDNTSGSHTIYRRAASSYISIGAAIAPLSTAAGSIVLCRFQIVGTSLKGKLWVSGTPEPGAWTVTATDSSVTAAGYAGVYASTDGNASPNMSFSDFNIDSLVSSELLLTLSPQAATPGTTLSITGIYSGTAPTGLQYAVDGGSYATVTSPAISGGNFSFSIPTPSVGTHSISVRDATTTTASDSGIYIINANTIAPNNSGIVYSPYNWNVNSSDAISINAGAYLKILFTGNSCVLNFNVANNLTPLSEIWTRIDDGPWTQYSVASSVALTIPSATLANSDVPYHRLDVYIKSTTETRNRWNAPSNTAVDFQGITLDNGAVIVAPKKYPKNLLIYGDSIGEGVRVLGETATNDTDRNDSMFVWTYALGEMLGVEVGNVCFGASGYTTSGSGNVPPLPSSYNLIYQGVSRTFTPIPDMIISNHGTNDNSTNSTTACTAFLNGMLTACPGKPIVLLQPFPATAGANQAPFLQAARAACNIPALVTYISTTGFFNTSYGSDSLNLHPSGPNSTGLIAPQVAAIIAPILNHINTNAGYS